MTRRRLHPVRQRIVAAAAELTTASGWAQLTMAQLADLVGVSRQTVYNEIGGKPQLAEAMVLPSSTCSSRPSTPPSTGTPTTWSARSRRPRSACSSWPQDTGCCTRS